MMQALLDGMSIENVDLTIKRLDNYIFKQKGKYFIAPQLKSYCLSQVHSDIGLNACNLMIDIMI